MNTADKSLEVVREFFHVINTGQLEKARDLMADDHIYHGPVFSTKNPDDYFRELMAFGMEFAVETHDLIATDHSVTHVSTLKVLSPVQASIPCCEVFDIENGKIRRQRFFFDTALFPKV